MFRILLLPFSVLYGTAIRFRNLLFDNKILKSHEFEVPVISVGNLAAGGTGKTPHVEYILQLLKGRKVAVLSRGYGRKTKGYREVTETSTWQEAGDEPVQYRQKNPSVIVAVCESRVKGINELIRKHQPDVILLDDAYQHRYVRPSSNILLTEWSKPYFNDTLLPAGSLREPASSSSRANMIAVTKSPQSLNSDQKNNFMRSLKAAPGQKVVFSHLSYGSLYSPGIATVPDEADSVLMVTGIANPAPMEEYLKKRFRNVTAMRFPDHHSFSKKDVNAIERNFNNIAGRAIIVTTEKDFVRLSQFETTKPLYILPVSVAFNPEDKIIFDQYILNHAGKDQIHR